MNVPFADLRAQYYEQKEEIDAAIVRVIESSRFSGGECVSRLESEIAAYCGAEHGVAVASGTDALVLALKAAGVGPGDEVITTPFTFGATAEAIVHVGATPIFADVDACTFNLDPAQTESLITPRTRALLPVDLYGQMADRSAFHELADRHGLFLLADSAQAIGARQEGLPIGMRCDAATLSFYPTKNLGAYGDGGMVLTNDHAIADCIRSLRGHGTVSHKYCYERVGYCSRLDAIQAAVLLAKLPRLVTWNEGRRRNAALYNELLAETAGTDGSLFLPRHDSASYHIYHQYTLRHTHRDALQTYLKQNGVETEVYYPFPLHLQPAYASSGYCRGDFPKAERMAREVLSLPIHPELTRAQIEYAAECIQRFVR